MTSRAIEDPGPASGTVESPAAQLRRFIARYSPTIAAQGRAALARLRRYAPGATELVYDNHNWLVVGFCPSERASDAVCSLVFQPRWLTLCFLQNAPKLPDPHGLLNGSGKQVRSLRFTSAKQLDSPPIRALILEALSRARESVDPTNRRKLVIRAVARTHRPRRP
jgi:hypothetical protein